jgi:hypothetical protein
VVRNIPQLADILIFIEPNCSTAGIAVQVGEDACLNKLLLCPLLAVFALQTAAHSAVPVWKLKKTSPVQGDVTVYTARTMTKVVSEKSSNYSMFRTQDKGFFTTFNPRTKTYHKIDGGMDNIQGFAKDFLNGPESSGSKSQGKTEK